MDCEIDLITASEKARLDIVEKLVMGGMSVDLELKDSQWTPLTVACVEGNFKIVKFLVNKGADVNKKNKNGSCPLSEAIKSNNSKSKFKIVKLLVSKGAYANVEDTNIINFLSNKRIDRKILEQNPSRETFYQSELNFII